MSSLEELKKIGYEHLKLQLHMTEILLSIDKDQVKEFKTWYNNHPLAKGIEEVMQILGRRSRQDPNSSSYGTDGIRP